MTAVLAGARRAGVVLGLPVVLVAVWWGVSDGSTNFFFPPLRRILSVFGPTWLEGRLTSDVLPVVTAPDHRQTLVSPTT